MRILQVTGTDADGPFEVVRTIAAGALAEGHEVLVALAERPGRASEATALVPPGAEVLALPSGDPSPGAQLQAVQMLRERVRAWAPGVVHLHGAAAGAVGAMALNDGVPALYTPHGSPAASPRPRAGRAAGARIAERAIARRVGLVGAVSQAEARFARGVLRARRVVVVPSGVPELDRGRLPPPHVRPERVVVTAGRIGPRRRPPEAAAILAAAGDLAALRWVGTGPADAGAPVRAAGVAVTGPVSRARLLEELAAATVYVHWTAWDGLSPLVLHALARDVVVVASDLPGNREVLGAAQVRDDPRAAADLVRRVLLEPALRAELRSEQRRRRGAFGAERCVAGWLEVYDGCGRA
jgi:glycosyltransferase involved in cell wall biosynthesis